MKARSTVPDKVRALDPAEERRDDVKKLAWLTWNASHLAPMPTFELRYIKLTNTLYL